MASNRQLIRSKEKNAVLQKENNELKAKLRAYKSPKDDSPAEGIEEKQGFLQKVKQILGGGDAKKDNDE